MARLAVLALLLAACDVGSVLPEGGAQGMPDAGGGGGGGGGSGSGGGSGGGGGSLTPLTVTFTTTPAGGVYDPANIVAVWVESSAGAFVKTIGRWSNVRTISLVSWNNKSGGADADAVSGATRTNHTNALTVTWDLKNRQNAIVPDGTYTIRMEVADANATTAGQNNQGTFTFVKGTSPQVQSGLTNGGFTNVSVNFMP